MLSRPHTHGVAAGDFNQDGKLDLVTESWAENKVTVVFGNGRGGFAGPGSQFDVGKRPYQRLRVADLNLDGNPDVVTTNLEGDNVTVLFGDGQGMLTKRPVRRFPAARPRLPWPSETSTETASRTWQLGTGQVSLIGGMERE